MPSSRSIKLVQAFLGDVVVESVREDRGLQDVPHNEEGLRLLAADGNWSGVVGLAEQLITKVDGDTLKDLATRLRFILVQVTAYMSMRQYAAAKKLVEVLGDLNSDRFTDPVTNESVVPFSLRFISALLPGFCGASMDTLRRLYLLLEECRQHGGVEASPTWSARTKRVQRALIVSHYQLGHYAEAVRLLEETIVAERYNSEEGGDHRVLQQMLHLQQFAALCLHYGNQFLAEDVFQAIEGLNISNELTDIKKFHFFLVMINQALWLTFNNRVDEASHIFCDVARGAREFCRKSNTLDRLSSAIPTISSQGQSGAADPTTSTKVQSVLCQKAFYQLWVNAVTSHVTCMPYEVTLKKNPTSVMGNIINTMEKYIRQDPVELSHCDAFLKNSVRLYTLEGNLRQKKIEMLGDLLEVFRCERNSMPALDKML